MSQVSRALVVTSLITTSAALPGFLVGSLGVQIRDDLQLSASALGFAIATFFFAAACCSFIGGSAAERRGPHRVLPYSLALSTVGYIGIALLASGLRSISLCTCIAGAANGLIQPGVNTLISRVVPTDQLGLAFAVKQSAIPATTLLGGVSVPLLGETVGWRFAFGLFAILPVSASVLLLRGFTAQAASNHLPERGRRPAQLPRSLGLLARNRTRSRGIWRVGCVLRVVGGRVRNRTIGRRLAGGDRCGSVHRGSARARPLV